MKLKKRKNPAFYKKGYHITSMMSYDDIIKSGELKITKNKNDDYDDIYPLFFVTREKLEFMTKGLNLYLSRPVFSIILELDVSEYNQYPDFGALHDLGLIGSYGNYYIYYTFEYNIPLHMKKWAKLFNNKIPKSEFFTNPKLIRDAIATTHSFSIRENIPISKIISVKQIK